MPGLRCSLAQLRNPADGWVVELVCFADQPLPEAPSGGPIALCVDDLDAALAGALRHRGRALGLAVRFPTGRAVYVREPAGSVIEPYEPAGDHTT